MNWVMNYRRKLDWTFEMKKMMCKMSFWTLRAQSVISLRESNYPIKVVWVSAYSPQATILATILRVVTILRLGLHHLRVCKSSGGLLKDDLASSNGDSSILIFRVKEDGSTCKAVGAWQVLLEVTDEWQLWGVALCICCKALKSTSHGVLVHCGIAILVLFFERVEFVAVV